MATDVRVQEYEIAERRLFQRYGLEYRSHYFQLKEPPLRARVIEVGSGPPVLFIWGDNDPFGGPEVGRRAAAIIPNAKLEVVPIGHLPWLDEPVQCGRVVGEFLGQPQ